MDFSFSEEHRLIGQSIRKLCQSELEPQVGDLDREDWRGDLGDSENYCGQGTIGADLKGKG